MHTNKVGTQLHEKARDRINYLATNHKQLEIDELPDKKISK